MFPILSITGLFKMVLIILGIYLVLRFFVHLTAAKRSEELARRLSEEKRQFEKEKQEQQHKVGKTEIIDKKSVNDSVQDVDFEEV